MKVKEASAVLFLCFLLVGRGAGAKAPHSLPEKATPVKSARLVFLGDSLTEGYGVAKDKAYPALIEQKIKDAGLNWQVINAGVSGSTSASAKSRLDWQLKSRPEVIVIALGANDGLRGFKPEDTRKNLDEAITKAKSSGVRVVLAGMEMPPNYGDEYREQFRRVYPELAKKHKIDLIPFLLDKVGGEKSLNLEDGIHPNEKGYVIVANTVWRVLEPVLKNTPQRK